MGRKVIPARHSRMTPVQRNLAYIRQRLRYAAAMMAKVHRGCKRARGCGCVVDRSMTLLESSERVLWGLELESVSGTNMRLDAAAAEMADMTIKIFDEQGLSEEEREKRLLAVEKRLATGKQEER